MNDGIENEKRIINKINNKKISELDFFWKNTLEMMFEYKINPDSIVHTRKLYVWEKADIEIKIDKITKYVSIKTGSSNSIHVEKASDFAIFLHKCNLDKECIKCLLFYHYGDNTINGTGTTRMDSTTIKQKYPKMLQKLNKSLNDYKILDKVIDRVLIKGKHSYYSADYLYYGNEQIGQMVKTQDIKKYLLKHKFMYINTPHFSAFTYQPHDRDFHFKNNTKRHYMQIKWISLASDLSKIIKQNLGEKNDK